VEIYISKLKSQTADGKVYDSFVIGITEKILAANALRKVYKLNGLQDKTMEIILGRALLLQALEKTQGAGAIVLHDSIGKTMKEAEEKLAGIIMELSSEAFENKNPKAINSIAELIPAIAESRRKKFIKEDIKPEMNVKDYESILSAA
jgi:hypothetical protein